MVIIIEYIRISEYQVKEVKMADESFWQSVRVIKNILIKCI